MPEIRLESKQYSYGHNTYHYSPDLHDGVPVPTSYSFADALIIDIRSFEKISINMTAPSTGGYAYRIRLTRYDVPDSQWQESHFDEIPNDASGNPITETTLSAGKSSEFTLLNLFHGKSALMIQAKASSPTTAEASVVCI